jgi:Holliday junction resolvase RusA-like endonuclease
MAMRECPYPVVLTIRQAPDVRLSANARRRGNYWEQRAVTSVEKAGAIYELNDQWPSDPLDGDLSLLVRIIWPRGKGGRLPDVDQLGSYVKPHIDALEGLVVHNDDQFRRVAFEQQRADDITARYYPAGCVQFVIETWREVIVND